MAKIINGTRVVTNEIRASYVHVAEPQSVNDGDKKYSMSVIIPKSDKDTIDLINKAIDQAIKESVEQGVKGKATTPFLLARVVELTGGDSLESNIQLVYNNAALGAEVAKALCSK